MTYRINVIYRLATYELRICRVSVLEDIQTLDFLVERYSYTYGLLDQEPYQQGSGEYEGTRGKNTESLYAQQLKAAAKEQTVSCCHTGDTVLSKQAYGQSTEYTIDKVHGDGANRVIELGFIDDDNREDNQYTSDCTNDEGASHTDEGTSASDGNQTGQAAVDAHAKVGLAEEQP